MLGKKSLAIHRLVWPVVISLAGAGCGLAGATPSSAEDVTSAQLAIANVPDDGSVGCIQLSATGSFVTRASFDVVPGASAVFTLAGISIGTVRFDGSAFAGACATVAPGATPTWVSPPVFATAVQGQTVSVTLTMQPAANAPVTIDFDAGSSCRSDLAPCLHDAECCSGACGVDRACHSTSPPAGCATAADCGAAGPCAIFTCTAGACAASTLAAGTPCTTSTNHGVCDAGGACVVATLQCFTPFDCPVSANPCVAPACNGGACATQPAPAGTQCTTPTGPGACNGGGTCVPSCFTPLQCPQPSNPCTVATCSNGLCGTAFAALGAFAFGIAETCGGSICDGAGNAVAVAQEWGTPCGNAGEVCDGDMGCIPAPPPTCTDGVKDGLESDVDCGGPLGTCARCHDGAKCSAATDCAPNVACIGGVCAESACHNGAFDPAFESDVDCGMTCGICGPGKHCYTNADCTTGACFQGICTGCFSPSDCPATGSECTEATCTNGVCGTAPVPAGPVLVSCAEFMCDGAGNLTAVFAAEWGVPCADIGAANAICNGRAFPFSGCVAAPPKFCSDGQRDGLESDIDCGGPTTCARCRDGQACTDAGDCPFVPSPLPGPSCSSGVCQVPSCHDGAYDITSESDVDCGVTCGPCGSGLRCFTNADCKSGACVSGICD